MISVTYAGAGGGKTTSMVSKIIEKLENLDSNKFICVVTFTNDATQDIKNKINEQTVLPANVFIGTIHSFLLRFIIKPHYPDGGNISVVSQIQDSKEIMRSYTRWAKRIQPDDELAQKRIIAAGWNKQKKAIYEKLLNQNLITNDQLIKLSRDIVSKAMNRKAIAKKIQYLFVDEYQDTYKWQHEIFLQIHKCKKTELHVIGDPNQSIYSFAYGTSENGARRPETFDDFPICKLRTICNEYDEKTINYRSSTEIVDLANTFNTDFQQSSNYGKFTPVLFINSDSSDSIYKIFHDIRDEHKLLDSVFYISKQSKSLEPYESKIKDSVAIHKCIRSIESSISQYTGMSVRTFCLKNSISRLQFRTLAVLCGKQDTINLKVIKSQFKAKYRKTLIYENQKLKEQKPAFLYTNTTERALTIHKCKGLEAESVLFIFDTNNHIKKVLTKKAIMKSATDDDLRLGYVGVTRAKKLLVLSCKEKISQENIDLLVKINVGIV